MPCLYLNMNSADSNIELPVPLKLNTSGVAIVDISGEYFPRSPGKVYYLCCDFVEPSVLQGKKNSNVFPILRMLNFKAGKNKNEDYVDKIKENYAKLIFTGCNRDEVQDLRLYLIDEDGNLPSFEDCQLKCTLLIIPRNGTTT